MTPHNEANLGDIAENVLMPGDPLRAKYIAENFLSDAKLINSVRNMLSYTGFYKGKRITVFSSGMGMPSMGIYSYELFKFYNVQNIIRIGTCGAYSKDLNMLDTILVDNSFTIGNFAKALKGEDCHLVHSSDKINAKIIETAKSLGYDFINSNADTQSNASNDKDISDSTSSNISETSKNAKIIFGNTVCSEIFDYYAEDFEKFISVFPKDLNIIAAEMEAFALFYTAKYFEKDASCLLSVVDSHFKKQEVSSKERETSLNSMIKIALETAIKL